MTAGTRPSGAHGRCERTWHRAPPNLTKDTYAAEFNVEFETFDQTTASFERVRAAATKQGRDPQTLVYSVLSTLVCGRTDAEVAARADAIGESLDDELRASSFVGTPGELVEKFAKLQQAGASRLYLRVSDLTDLDHLELVATEIARQLP